MVLEEDFFLIKDILLGKKRKTAHMFLMITGAYCSTGYLFYGFCTLKY
jgi:hypothetical protein